MQKGLAIAPVLLDLHGKNRALVGLGSYIVNAQADCGAPHVPTDDNDLLQVMPWPIFAKMSDKELKAIYEYLSASPCLPSETNPTRCD